MCDDTGSTGQQASKSSEDLQLPQLVRKARDQGRFILMRNVAAYPQFYHDLGRQILFETDWGELPRGHMSLDAAVMWSDDLALGYRGFAAFERVYGVDYRTALRFSRANLKDIIGIIDFLATKRLRAISIGLMGEPVQQSFTSLITTLNQRNTLDGLVDHDGHTQPGTEIAECERRCWNVIAISKFLEQERRR